LSLSPRDTKKVADFEPLAKIALFCAAGLLISISVVLMYMRVLPAEASIPQVSLSLQDIQAKVDVKKLPNLEFEDQSLIFSAPARP
jgi:hypothetical protein